MCQGELGGSSLFVHPSVSKLKHLGLCSLAFFFELTELPYPPFSLT
jgi:hypothetical protein